MRLCKKAHFCALFSSFLAFFFARFCALFPATMACRKAQPGTELRKMCNKSLAALPPFPVGTGTKIQCSKQSNPDQGVILLDACAAAQPRRMPAKAAQPDPSSLRAGTTSQGAAEGRLEVAPPALALAPLLPPSAL